MALLYVRCPSCSLEFSSGFDVPPESLGQGNSTSCPDCGTPVLVAPDTVFTK